MTAVELGYRPNVGIMVVSRSGGVWIGRRADSPTDLEGPGAWWQMPQGGIDPSEDPAKAALRELHEETGIRSVRILGQSAGWYTYDFPAGVGRTSLGQRYRGQRQKWFAVRFLGDDSEVMLAQPGHKPEFDAWRWAGLGEIADLIVPFKRPVYDQVIRDLAALAVPGD